MKKSTAFVGFIMPGKDLLLRGGVAIRMAIAASLAMAIIALIIFSGHSSITEAVTCPSSISFGQTITCSITAGQKNQYTFSANANDRVLAEMVQTSDTGLHSEIRILSSGGNQVCAQSTSGTYLVRIDTCLLSASGTYTLEASDQLNNGTGSYDLYLQRTNNPGLATGVSFGQTVNGNLQLFGQFDTYTVSASGGDRILSRMADHPDELFKYVRIYNPDGTKLCEAIGLSGYVMADTGPCGPVSAAGTYTVIAGDVEGRSYDGTAAIGSYNVYFQRTNNPGGATAISYNTTVGGSVDGALMNAYTFPAAGGDEAYVRLVNTSSGGHNYYPLINVYAPDGSLVCTQPPPLTGFNELSQCPLSGGSYLVLIGSEFGGSYNGTDGSGDYRFFLQRSNNPVGAGSISNGTTVAGAISEIARAVAYKFNGDVGDGVVVTMTRTSGDFWPNLEIFKPDGTLLCGYSASSPATRLTCTIQGPGSYAIFASAYYYAGQTGSFTLTLAKAPPVYNAANGTASGCAAHGFWNCLHIPFTGDPVNIASGDFVHTHTDIEIPTLGVGLSFTRTYHSGLGTNGSPTPLGYGWTDNYNMYLQASASDQYVYYPDGHAVLFANSAGSYTPRPGVYETLSYSGGNDTFTLTTHQQVRYVFGAAAAGIRHLTTILDRNSNAINLTYDANGRLSKVADSNPNPSSQRYLQFAYDASNRISTITDSQSAPDTRTVQFTYDGNGNLWKVKDTKSDPLNGPFTVYTYDANHRMKTLTDVDGNPALKLQNYDASGRVVEQHDALDKITCIYYGTNPTYTQNCLSPGGTQAANQTVVRDPLGNITTYTFDDSFRLLSVTDANSPPGITQYSYDTSNNVSCSIDELGNKTAYSYLNGNLTQMIDANNTDPNPSTCQLKSGGVSWQYTYDSLNDITRQTDPLGNVTDYVHVHDASGNLARIVGKDAGGAVKALTCFARDGAGQVTALVESTDLVLPSGPTDPCTGHKTQFGYDPSGNLTSVINPRFSDEPNADTDSDSLGLNAVQSGGQCDSGGVAVPRFRNCIENFVGTDPARACAATPAANDEPVDAMPVDFNDDQLVNVTDRTLMSLAEHAYTANNVSGYNQRYDLNADGAINVTDHTIVELSMKASGGARCSQTTAPPKTVYQPDGAGRVLSVTNEVGQTTSSTYDNFNMLKTQADNLGNTTTSTYDPKGNLQTVTDANRATVGTPESGTQCGSAGTGNGVDDDTSDDLAAGSPAGVIDDGCPNMIYTYDAADRLTSVTDALGHKTTYSYDANGNLSTVTEPNRQSVNNPESGTAQCGTAGTGNQVDDDGDGVKDDGCPSTIYTYDALNRVSSMTDSLGRTTSYNYPSYNVMQVTDPRGIVTTSTLDALGRLYTVQASTGESVTYTYDDAGNRHQMIDGTGTTYYVPDALNRLSSVTYPGNNVVGYQYDAVGNLSQITYPGTTGNVQYQYNFDHSMSSVHQSWGSVGATNYTYNLDGSLKNATLPNNVSTAYGYDNADRLASVVNSQPGTPPTTMSTYTYTLDAVGNRTGMAGTGGPQTYQLDALYRLKQATYPGSTDIYTYDADGNRLTKNSTTYTYTGSTDQMTGDGSASYVYDLNGNLQTRGSDTFTFNYANRLTGATVGGVASTSTYNGDGLRMSHAANGQTANYIWDVNRSVPEILQDGTNTYVYGLGLISSTDGSGNQTYYDADGLGSTADLTNSSATKTDGYTYDALGAPTHSPGSSTQPFQFTGQQRDADSSLQYLRARYYDPSTGRFLSQDPMGLGNGYSYVSNNPVTLRDPSGLCPLQVVEGCIREPKQGDKEGGLRPPSRPTPQPTPTPTATPSVKYLEEICMKDPTFCPLIHPWTPPYEFVDPSLNMIESCSLDAQMSRDPGKSYGCGGEPNSECDQEVWFLISVDVPVEVGIFLSGGWIAKAFGEVVKSVVELGGYTGTGKDLYDVYRACF